MAGAESAEIEARAKRAVADRVRAALRLLSPEHITPIAARHIERILDEEAPPASRPDEADLS